MKKLKKKYGNITVLETLATNRGGLALITTPNKRHVLGTGKEGRRPRLPPSNFLLSIIRKTPKTWYLPHTRATGPKEKS